MNESATTERDRLWSAAELAEEFALTAQGIRFYEEKGLIAPARVGKTRVFGYRERARLILIQKLRRLGFSLDAIREYLSLYKADASGAERIAELEAKRRDIDEALAGLKTLEADAKERLAEALAGNAKPAAKRRA